MSKGPGEALVPQTQAPNPHPTRSPLTLPVQFTRPRCATKNGLAVGPGADCPRRQSCKLVSPMEQELIDRIYECAFVPELWPDVLDELAKIAGARGGFLFAANKEVLNWTASASLCAGMEVFV